MPAAAALPSSAPTTEPAAATRPAEPMFSAASAPAASAGPPSKIGNVVLDVRDLRTYFFTYDGVVKALDGVTFNVRRGETVGLVGETGCGKSVTAFSIAKLIPDPPGRIMGGTILFKGANLLFGVENEATFKPIKGTNRVKVSRRYRRIRQGLDRMVAVRGGGISMIFQEPTSAMNPIFSISNQISETILLHRGEATIKGLLGSTPRGPAVEATIKEMLRVARLNDGVALREATDAFGRAANLPSLSTEAYYLLRNAWADPDAKLPEIRKALRRAEVSGIRRAYLRAELRRLEQAAQLKRLYLDEMRTGKVDRGRRGGNASRRLSLWVQGLPYKVWGLRGHVRKPLTQETFWRSVRLLEAVSIANPVQVARGYPHELSGGMLQRVMIAMALSAEPELLIADEPTTALDVTIQAQILELMRDLKERIGTATLLITHDLGVIAEVADRVCVMYAGNVVEVGPVKEIFKRPLHPYTQGLLNSIPRMDEPDKKLESIPGSVPNLITPPSGCRFHPRCPHAMPVCRERRPPMTTEGEQHTAACYLYNGPIYKG